MNGIEEREVAEIAKFTPVELKEYEDSIKTYRDLKNSLDTAEEKGRVEGRVEGEKRKAIAIARNLKSMGMSISDVSKATGLQEEEIKALWITKILWIKLKYYEWFEYLCSLFPFSNIGARGRRSSINNDYDIEELKSAMTNVSRWFQVFGKNKITKSTEWKISVWFY